MRRAGVVVATVTLVLMVILGPAATAAIDWRTEVSIARSDGGSFIVDAGYRDKLTVIAWQVAGDAGGVLNLAISRDAGRGTFTTRHVAEDVVGMAVAACEHDIFVAYRERRADGALRLRLARVPSDSRAIARVTVRRSVAAGGTLDVACGSHRVTVAWTERVGSTWHARVRHVRLDDLARTPVKDLGAAHRSRVAAAASGDRAYVAWSDASGLRFKRFVVGDGPAFAVTARPTQRLGHDAYDRAPALAADGTSVAAGYRDYSWAWVETSPDRGVTFTHGTGIGFDPGSSAVLSLAVEGERAVLTVVIRYGEHEPDFGRLSSTDRGASWRHMSVEQGVVRPLDGFLVTGTGTKLAETFTRRDGDTRGWELFFRRQR